VGEKADQEGRRLVDSIEREEEDDDRQGEEREGRHASAAKSAAEDRVWEPEEHGITFTSTDSIGGTRKGVVIAGDGRAER